MELTVKEQKWLDRLEKVLDAAPRSLGKKVRSYTIGDDNITLYDKRKYEEFVGKYERRGIYSDVGPTVEASDSQIRSFDFPFCIESTAG